LVVTTSIKRYKITKIGAKKRGNGMNNAPDRTQPQRTGRPKKEVKHRILKSGNIEKNKKTNPKQRGQKKKNNRGKKKKGGEGNSMLI